MIFDASDILVGTFSCSLVLSCLCTQHLLAIWKESDSSEGNILAKLEGLVIGSQPELTRVLHEHPNLYLVKRMSLSVPCRDVSEVHTAFYVSTAVLNVEVASLSICLL